MKILAIVFALPLLAATACSSTSSAGRSRATTTTARTGTTPDAGAPAPGVSTGRPTGGDQSGDNPATRGDTGASASAGTSVDTGSRASSDLKAHSDDQIVRGQIADATSDAVTIRASDGSTKTLLLVPQTTVQIDGREARTSDLREGLPVRASFSTSGRQRVAVQVIAGQGADQGAAAQEQPMTPGSNMAGTNVGGGGGGERNGEAHTEPNPASQHQRR